MTSWAETSSYEVLGVGRYATASDIRDAYRRLALERHPDKNPGDPRAVAAFQQLREAYEVLYDECKRRAYDSKHSFSREYFANTARNTPSHGGSTDDAAERLRTEKRDQEWAKQAQRRAMNIGQLANEVSSLNAAVIELDLKAEEIRAEEESSKTLLGYISSFWSAEKVKTQDDRSRQKLEYFQQRLATDMKLERARVRFREAEQDHRRQLRQQDQVKREEAGQRARNRRAREEEEAARATQAATERAREEARQRQQQEDRWKREQQAKERRERDLRQELLNKLAKQPQPAPTVSPAPEAAHKLDDFDHQQRRSRRPKPTPGGQAKVCRHKRFWPKVNGRHSCSICCMNFNSFILQCPDCNIMACASCKKSLRMS